MKNREKNSYEPLDKKSFKKKFLVRKHEEREKEQEIKEFIDEDDVYRDLDATQKPERT